MSSATAARLSTLRDSARLATPFLQRIHVGLTHVG
jgi:hypothetical protein